MPIALSRSQTAPVWLKSDMDVPEAERPTFDFFHLTRDEVRQVGEWLASVADAKNIAEIEAILDKVIGLGLAGWRNMTDRDGKEIAYTPGGFNKLLTLDEKMELASLYPAAIQDGERKKKALERRSSSATAEPAPAAAASAPTPQPNPPPCS